MQRDAVDVETVAGFDAIVESGTHHLRGYRFQDLDLRGRETALLRLDPAGASFLGCDLTPRAEAHVRSGGGLVFPVIDGVPFDPYRAHLYTADELYTGLEDGYASTPDARAYAWDGRARRRRPATLPVRARPPSETRRLDGNAPAGSTSHDGDTQDTLARALHDHAMSDALTETLSGERVVGVMGGHATRRSDPGYAAAARLGRALARDGLLVVTGGGPGAMEAVNLGAYLAPYDDADLDVALAMLAASPSWSTDVTGWARAGFAVRKRWPAASAGTSIGIPTWHYGHEPPNVFPSGIAKYFHNALREDGLLQRSTAGVVVLPGAAGTVQEVFTAVTTGYYSDRAGLAPLVLVGERHWTTELPVWPLVSALAAGRALAAVVRLVPDPDEAAVDDTIAEVLAALDRTREPAWRRT